MITMQAGRNFFTPGIARRGEQIGLSCAGSSRNWRRLFHRRTGNRGMGGAASTVGNRPPVRGSTPRVILVDNKSWSRRIPTVALTCHRIVPPRGVAVRRSQAGAQRSTCAIFGVRAGPGKSVRSIIRHTSADVAAKRTRHRWICETPGARAIGQMRATTGSYLRSALCLVGQRRAKVTVSPQLRAANGVSVRFR